MGTSVSVEWSLEREKEFTWIQFCFWGCAVKRDHHMFASCLRNLKNS